MAFNWCDLYSDRTFLQREADYREGQGLVPEFFGTARTKDGKYIVVVSTESAQFAKAFDRPDIAKALGKPVTIREMMAEEVGKHTLEEVMKRYKEFDLAGIQVPLTDTEVIES